MSSTPGPVTPCIVVHGGAGQLSNPSIFPMLIIGVKKAARSGYDVLIKGGENAAVDAVEAAIKVSYRGLSLFFLSVCFDQREIVFMIVLLNRFCRPRVNSF